MKKLTALLMILTLSFYGIGCGGGADDTGTDTGTNGDAADTADHDDADHDDAAGDDAAGDEAAGDEAAGDEGGDDTAE